MKKVVLLIFVSMAILSMYSCSNDPSKDDLKIAISEKLPSNFEVVSIKINAKENIGTKVEPKYHFRYTASIKVLHPTYEKIDFIGGDVNADVVKLVFSKNSTFEAFGKATSSLTMNKWDTRITEFQTETNKTGFPLGNFQNAVVEGSNEYDIAITKLKEWEQAKIEKIKKLSDDFKGKWVGSYICGQGHTGLTLTISTVSKDISAIFEFYPSSSNAQGKSGSFKLQGSFSENGSFVLKPTEWINKPSGFFMVGLTGEINDARTELSGLVKSSGCQSFHLVKKSI
jgi:hypothetical protein